MCTRYRCASLEVRTINSEVFWKNSKENQSLFSERLILTFCNKQEYKTNVISCGCILLGLAQFQSIENHQQRTINEKPPILIDFSLKISKTSNMAAHTSVSSTLEPHAYQMKNAWQWQFTSAYVLDKCFDGGEISQYTHKNNRAVRTHALAPIYRVHSVAQCNRSRVASSMCWITWSKRKQRTHTWETIVRWIREVNSVSNVENSKWQHLIWVRNKLLSHSQKRTNLKLRCALFSCSVPIYYIYDKFSLRSITQQNPNGR